MSETFVRVWIRADGRVSYGAPKGTDRAALADAFRRCAELVEARDAKAVARG